MDRDYRGTSNGKDSYEDEKLSPEGRDGKTIRPQGGVRCHDGVILIDLFSSTSQVATSS